MNNKDQTNFAIIFSEGDEKKRCESSTNLMSAQKFCLLDVPILQSFWFNKLKTFASVASLQYFFAARLQRCCRCLNSELKLK